MTESTIYNYMLCDFQYNVAYLIPQELGQTNFVIRSKKNLTIGKQPICYGFR